MSFIHVLIFLCATYQLRIIALYETHRVTLDLLVSGFSCVHQSLPPGERGLCVQEEDQVGSEVSGSSLQPGPGLL